MKTIWVHPGVMNEWLRFRYQIEWLLLCSLLPPNLPTNDLSPRPSSYKTPIPTPPTQPPSLSKWIVSWLRAGSVMTLNYEKCFVMYFLWMENRMLFLLPIIVFIVFVVCLDRIGPLQPRTHEGRHTWAGPGGAGRGGADVQGNGRGMYVIPSS